VLVHVADPVAFFQPLDRHNERLEELCGEPQLHHHAAGTPSFQRLMESWEAVVSAHPATTFIGAHVGCYAENLGWVDRMLCTYPNLTIDIAGRLAELGRQPRATRRLVERHPDRVMFGTDCYPVDADGFADYFRFVETDDECYDYAPWADVPPTGRWDIAAADIPGDLLPGLYAGNARRVLRL
jgi:predicted TIM-barrel fold metal-dependent hydrolase